MKDLKIEDETNEELEARIIMAEEWNQFQVPQEIDDRITELFYWNEEKEHPVILKIINEFDALECYAKKCFWFSSANFQNRKSEEKVGAFYNSGACKPSCVPRKFRNEESLPDQEQELKPSNEVIISETQDILSPHDCI